MNHYLCGVVSGSTPLVLLTPKLPRLFLSAASLEFAVAGMEETEDDEEEVDVDTETGTSDPVLPCLEEALRFKPEGPKLSITVSPGSLCGGESLPPQRDVRLLLLPLEDLRSGSGSLLCSDEMCCILNKVQCEEPL